MASVKAVDGNLSPISIISSTPSTIFSEPNQLPASVHIMSASNENEDHLFHSAASPASSGTFGPDEHVMTLVGNYDKIDVAHPVLKALFKDPDHKILFFDVFDHDLKRIKSRSQNFDRGQVTVYDKALLTLTKNGNDIYGMGGVELYMKEFIGIGRSSGVGEPEVVLLEHISLRSMLKEVFHKKSQGSQACSARRPDTPKSQTSTTVKDPKTVKDAQANKNTKLHRIWKIFQTAKEEYLAIPDSFDRQMDKFRATRFLRDTAENVIFYLDGQRHDPAMMKDAKDTFEMVKNTAVVQSGGRKRSFDVSEMERVGGVPKAPRTGSNLVAIPRNGRGGVADCYRP